MENPVSPAPSPDEITYDEKRSPSAVRGQRSIRVHGSKGRFPGEFPTAALRSLALDTIMPL
jgi:hypothetical protein